MKGDNINILNSSIKNLMIELHVNCICVHCSASLSANTFRIHNLITHYFVKMGNADWFRRLSELLSEIMFSRAFYAKSQISLFIHYIIPFHHHFLLRFEGIGNIAPLSLNENVRFAVNVKQIRQCSVHNLWSLNQLIQTDCNRNSQIKWIRARQHLWNVYTFIKFNYFFLYFWKWKKFTHSGYSVDIEIVAWNF